MLNIKILLSLLAIVGLGVSLGEMLGYFKDQHRINFVKIIEKELECPKEHPGAVQFIKDFVYSNPDYKNMDLDGEVEKIVFVGNWLGNLSDKTGRHVDSVMSGTLKLKHYNGQVSKALCSFEELKVWSREAPFFKWLGWGIVATSVFLGIVLLVIEEIVNRKGTI